MNHEPDVDTVHTLFGNLLDERLLHYRRVGSGERIACTLPELFIAMAQDQVRDFPALRAHQRHPWHAFLVQLAAIALHRAGRIEPFATADTWRSALLALTPEHPDGAAWCLVAPVDRPAFMQAPVRDWSVREWANELLAADEIDVLKASKNHDLKRRRMTCAAEEDWVFALVSLQTQSPSDSGAYKESSRVAGGYGRRPGVGIAPPGGPGERWRRDVQVLLRARPEIAKRFGCNGECLAITWLAPWGGTVVESLTTERLDPFYIEITRRIRLFADHTGVGARTAKTPNARIKPIHGALTGDIWSPIQFAKKEGREDKIFTLSRGDFGYETAVQFVLPGDFMFSPAMRLQATDPASGLQVVMQSIALGNENTNHGYHERRVPITKKMYQGLLSRHTDELAKLAGERVAIVGAVTNMLEQALMVLFGKSLHFRVSKSEFLLAIKNSPRTLKERASLFAQPFESECDAQFFPELIDEIESDNRESVRTRWLCELADRAERVLRSAFDAGPRSAQMRYRAQSAALVRLHGLMRSDKSKLPTLALALKAHRSNASASTTEENHEHA